MSCCSCCSPDKEEDEEGGGDGEAAALPAGDAAGCSTEGMEAAGGVVLVNNVGADEDAVAARVDATGSGDGEAEIRPLDESVLAAVGDVLLVSLPLPPPPTV